MDLDKRAMWKLSKATYWPLTSTRCLGRGRVSPARSLNRGACNGRRQYPLYIASDLLLRLFEQRNYVESMVLMVQLEVADRLAAQPGGSEFGLLSATAQLIPVSINYSRFHRVRLLLRRRCTQLW